MPGRRYVAMDNYLYLDNWHHVVIRFGRNFNNGLFNVYVDGEALAAVDGVKKIDDLGVFFTTATFSIFAYVWLFLCLQVYTEGEVTVTEAAWTFAFFFILIIIAVSADKYRQVVKRKESS